MPPRPGMPPMGARPPIPPPQQGPQKALAAQGRLGDTLIAHLTPGEIQLPPQIQTPELLHAVHQAFGKFHINPAQFTAGSPASSVNPKTGIAEYNFWSSFLPVALGIGGSLIAPGLGTGLSAGLASAIGGGVGTMAGNMIGGNSMMNSLLAGGLAGVGSYGLGSLMAPSSATTAAQQAAAYTGATPESQVAQDVAQEGMAAPTLGSTPSTSLDDVIGNLKNPGGALSAAAPSSSGGGNASASAIPSLSNLWGNMPSGINLGSVGGAGLGAALGSSMFQPTPPSQPVYPPGFTTPMTPTSQLPSYQTLLGENTYNGPTPNFTGYNPATNSPAAFNFYPITPTPVTSPTGAPLA